MPPPIGTLDTPAQPSLPEDTLPHTQNDTPLPDLTRELLLVRRGGAYFDRKLSELTDDEYDDASLLPGWTRRFVIAHVAYNARALARLVEWARTGIESPMYESMEQRNAEIEAGATLSPMALRGLYQDSAETLNTAWRDLPADRWMADVRNMQGRTMPVAQTVWMRSREVWLHAVDLGNGGNFTEMPADFIDRLLQDITAYWAGRGVGQNIVFAPTDRPVPIPPADQATGSRVPPPTILRAPAAQLTQWAAGRDPHTFTTDAGEPLPPPRWL